MCLKIECIFLFLYLSLVYEYNVCCCNYFVKLNKEYKT